MSVVGIARERPDSPEATLELNKMSFTRRFLVQTNNINDGPVTVCSAIGIPRPFQIYSTPNEFQRYARCRSVDAQRIEPRSLYWEVTCHYSTPDVENGTNGASNATEKDGQNDNPLLLIPEIETHTERYEQPIYWIYSPTTTTVNLTGSTAAGSFDLTNLGDTSQVQIGMTVTGAGIPANTTVSSVDSGTQVTISNQATVTGAGVALTFTATQLITPCKATNGEIFDPPPMKDASRLILSITRNEDITAPHPLTSILFTDTVNSDVFFGCGAGQVKCMGITASKQTKQLSNGAVFAYLKCVYQFQMRPSWDLQILNAGNWYWADATKKLKRKFLTEDGHPRQGLLDANGSWLPDGGKSPIDGTFPPAATPLFISVRPYQRQKFSTLNLPQSFLQAS